MNEPRPAARARRASLPFAAFALAALSAGCSSSGGDAPAAADPAPALAGERVGTYDGRAVVIAYVNGPRFDAWMKQLRGEHERAKAAGDTARAAELEKQAQDRQARFHGQAFDGDDIDDVLAVVKDELPAVLAAAKVARLEKVNEARGQDVVTVDVTDRLVALFEPNEKGRRWIADIRSKPFSR